MGWRLHTARWRNVTRTKCWESVAKPAMEKSNVRSGSWLASTTQTEIRGTLVKKLNSRKCKPLTTPLEPPRLDENTTNKNRCATCSAAEAVVEVALR